MKHVYTKAALVAALVLSVSSVTAAVSEDELTRLETDLTPMGSERAGKRVMDSIEWFLAQEAET